MSIRITRVLEWDSGHRVLGHEGKCRFLHGHRYTAEVTVAPLVEELPLDNLGRVLDFSVVKELVGAWVDHNWDHNVLLHERDPLLQVEDPNTVFGPRSPYVMPGNPTAENMAQILFNRAQALLRKKGIEVVNVRIYETPNCWADYNERTGQ
jgi:6-pyruvoyltetrahydropterin/6-carboxytetrahydropterin synthase